MIVPNRDLGNKQFLSSAFTSSTVQIAPLSHVAVMDVDKVDNFDDIRERSSLSSKVSFRSTSVSLSTSSIPYHKRMVINNNIPDEEFKEPIDSFQLSYKDNSQERNHVSMATDLVPSQGPQCVSNEALALNTYNVPHVDDVNIINIQLLHDPD